jgi:hypothetical protein
VKALLVFTCHACGHMATGDPEQVIVTHTGEELPTGDFLIHRDRPLEPVCRSCASVLIDRARKGDLPNFPSRVLEPDYLDRAYGPVEAAL